MAFGAFAGPAYKHAHAPTISNPDCGFQLVSNVIYREPVLRKKLLFGADFPQTEIGILTPSDRECVSDPLYDS